LYTPEGPADRESAILVGARTPDVSPYDLEDSMDELALLADTAGADVTDRVTQNLTRLKPATFIGSGKVSEIKRLAKERDSNLVIFDDDLAPVQVRNLEKEIDCKLLDRPGLILDIFAERAQTAAAKTQVELAQLDYTRSRLTRRWTHLSRQEGGIGTKGPGETQIETDRRLIDKRIDTLEERLQKIDRQRATQRKGRSEHLRVSLVGYTNAGKSTLMNALAGADVFAENRLFATLDSTTRSLELGGGKELLLSDTVGFIRKLPHKLIESFKSTLDEVRESDFLLHVVDATHRRSEDHIRVVRETLAEMDMRDKPSLLVFNKIDAIEERSLLAGLRREYPEAAFVSALRGMGLGQLREQLTDLVEERYVEHTAVVPVTEPQLISRIHDLGEVKDEEYTYARNGAEQENPTAVARLRFKMPRRYNREITSQLRPFTELTPIEADGE